MTPRIVEEPPTLETLREYVRVSIAFVVDSHLRVEAPEQGLGGIRLVEESVEPSWVKDYDDPPQHSDDNVLDWPKRWDIKNWGVLSVFDGEQRVGGAIVAWKTDRLWFNEGRDDLASLFDIRVAPEHRRTGIGSLIFDAVIDWAKQRGCTELKIETQNINVRACRFYVSRGCALSAINRHAYSDFPGEVQLIWRRKL